MSSTRIQERLSELASPTVPTNEPMNDSTSRALGSAQRVVVSPPKAAHKLCKENPSPSTSIVAAGLVRVDPAKYDPEQVKEAIEEASAEELAGPFVLINYLSVIGSLSPMVGLLGTVSGMVKAFNVIEAEGAGSAQALAGNISEALITTATGMIVGIPAMFFFFFFKNRYGKITSRIGRIVGDLQFTLNKALQR